MSSYNNTIVQKIVDYIEGVVSTIESKDELGRSVVLSNYKMVATDNLEINTLMSNNLTAQFTVILNFEILDENGVPIQTQSSEIYIPRLINNIFIIQGTPRIPTQTLDNDSICKVYKRNIMIRNGFTIEYNYSEGNLSYDIRIFNRHTGVDYEFSDKDNLLDPEVIKILSLEPDEILKLKIKLDRDDIPSSVTPDLILNLVKLGPDIDRDSIIDKTITSTEIDLINSLYKRKLRKTILTNVAKKFFQYGNIYLTDIQNAIDRYFKVADDQTIDIPSTVNPLIYDALKYKITIPKHVAYNQSFTDLIDPVNTPENNNVNRINELNVCASVDNGVIYIKCYNLKGERLKLRYLEYLSRPVLSNEYYDYDEKQVVKSDTYLVKLRLKEYQVKDLSVYENLLVEPKPDEKLSVTTRRIPMVNVSDSVRVAMGSSMSKQAIEIEECEPPLVVSGNDDEDLIDSALITRYHGKGAVVKKIDGNKIFLESDEGSISFVEVNQPTVGSNDAVITFESNVVEGQRLSDSDILIQPKILMNNSYELGINARAFYMNYLGWSHEDGIIISESFARKISSYSLIEVALHVKQSDIVSFMKVVGSKIQSGDILVNCITPMRGSRLTKNMFESEQGLFPMSNFNRQNNNLIVPNNVDLGYVVGVHIQEVSDSALKTSSDVTKETINNFLKDNSISTDWDQIPEKFKHLKILDGEMYNTDSYLITYKIIKYRPGIRGTKLCNRYGSKGEVSLILPDNLMPRLDEDGEGNGAVADIILNPAAIIARKNPSQLYEALLTKIIRSIYKKLVIMCGMDKVSEAKEFTKKYYGSKFTNLTDSEFLSKVKSGITEFRIATGSFSKISYETMIEWAKEFNISELQEVYCPDVIIADGVSGQRAYDPSKVDVSNIKGGRLHELGFLEQPIITGETYIMKLYHSADYVGKVTPNQVEASEPYMKRGLYRPGGGQKIGEMEFWSLLSYGTESFVRDNNQDALTSQYEFLNELLLAGYAMVDGEGLPLLSNYRSKLLK